MLDGSAAVPLYPTPCRYTRHRFRKGNSHARVEHQCRNRRLVGGRSPMREETRWRMKRTVMLHVNGVSHRVEADDESMLLYTLRDDLDLTGSKYGCGEGQCGACTVLLDGRAVRSCITPVSAAE